MVKVDGGAVLSWTSETQAGGTTGKVLVRTRRSGTPDTDSTNTAILTATNDVTATDDLTGRLFWQGRAEQQ
jgi:hypothetical protein